MTKAYGCTYVELVDQIRRMGGVNRKGIALVAELCGCRTDDVKAAIEELIKCEVVTWSKLDRMYYINKHAVAAQARELEAMGSCSMSYVPVELIHFESEFETRKRMNKEERRRGIMQEHQALPVLRGDFRER